MESADKRPNPPLRIAIDTGGTFTDAVAIGPSSAPKRVKVLSSAALRGRVATQPAPRELTIALPNLTVCAGLLSGFTLRRPGGETLAEVSEHPDSVHVLLDRPVSLEKNTPIELQAPFDAPRLALHLLLGRNQEDSFADIAVRVATTRGTNALLEGTGDPFALVLDEGLEDLLEIGDQSREDIFALDIKRRCLHPRLVVGIGGRLDARGNPLGVLSDVDLDALADRLQVLEVKAIGIALLHAWRSPEQERALANALRQRGIKDVICSTDLSLAQGLLPRTETLAVEVTLRRILDEFVDKILPETQGREHLSVMTSSGGLTPAADFRAKDGLLSGPAGGVVGAATAGRSCSIDRLLGFDMGGTSTDVSRYDKEFIYRFETRVGPARIQAPCVAIESVAAGGGSICHVSEEGLAVGPRSAGATPGPACYGAGGPLTLTDVNLLLGRGDPDLFGIPIELHHAEEALECLRQDLRAHGQDDPGREAVLEGLLDIANERMAEAMRSISIREGADPGQNTLVPFGGAGGQHACAIAERLGIRRILVPKHAGLLSAFGVLNAREERFAEATVLRTLEEAIDSLDEDVHALESEALAKLSSESGTIGRRILALRLAGQDAVIQVEHVAGDSPERRFRKAFRNLYGYPPPDRAIEVAWIRVVAIEDAIELDLDASACDAPAPSVDPSKLRMHTRGVSREVAVIARGSLASGSRISGPMILHEDGATTVVDEGWAGQVLSSGALLLESENRQEPGQALMHGAQGAAAAELVSARLGAIATGMGHLLERSALSVNVKQRLDFSCAVLDDAGRLLVNAPHMPIHLGSMGICVRRTLDFLDPGPGDLIVTNHPACGGSHLPDLTTIAPVHERPDGGKRLGFVAVRAHHAEIGGTRPGSTPPFATHLIEEGVLIAPLKVVTDGQSRLDEFSELLRSARWPSRRPEENLADLQAQIAATRHGVERIGELAAAIGSNRYATLAQRVHDNAASAARTAIARLGTFERTVSQKLDDGALIQLHVRCDGERMLLDFSGSSGVHPGNFNAPIAITTGAVVYLMRILADREVPMNEGLLVPVDLVIPPGMLNPGFTGDAAVDPAVCAGNTETSQRIVDTLLLPFELAASSQGTMNNFLFGTDAFGYYETIAGGAGATPQAPGCSGVHTHMTNTRITDPEILEDRYPVRLERFRIRRSSGGRGAHRGGDGLVRSIRALETIEVSLVGQHRVEQPYGLSGGSPGAPGKAYIDRIDGSHIELDSSAECTLNAGDLVTIETPGGGGWGEA